MEKDEISNDLKCPICLDLFTNPIIDTCGHTFCSICIKKHLKNNTMCPISKFEISNINFIKNLSLQSFINNLKLKCQNCEKFFLFSEKKCHKIKCDLYKTYKCNETVDLIFPFRKKILELEEKIKKLETSPKNIDLTSFVTSLPLKNLKKYVITEKLKLQFPIKHKFILKEFKIRYNNSFNPEIILSQYRGYLLSFGISFNFMVISKFKKNKDLRISVFKYDNGIILKGVMNVKCESVGFLFSREIGKLKLEIELEGEENKVYLFDFKENVKIEYFSFISKKNDLDK